MINYSLRCDATHVFEAWFRSSADFDEQAQRGLLSCPICGSSKIEKAIMSPAVARRDRGRAVPQPQEQTDESKTKPEPKNEVVAAAKPSAPPVNEKMAQLWQMARKLQAHVEANFENVGRKFPEEVRKMHTGESEHRDVYGEASLEDAKDLLDEGIDIMPLPRLPKLDG